MHAVKIAFTHKPLPLTIDIRKVIENGFWFCGREMKVREVEEIGDTGLMRCKECGSIRVKWCPPINWED